jgi:hypothetical protein
MRKRVEPEPYRDGFHVLEIVRSSGAHALVVSRARVVNAQVETFFAENPGEPCDEYTIVRKQGREHAYWMLEPAPAEVGDPDERAGDEDEFPVEMDQSEDVDEGDEDELDQQVEYLAGGYGGLYLVFDVETRTDEYQNGRVLAWSVHGLRPLEVHRTIARGRTLDPPLLDTCVERGLVYFPNPLLEGDIAACQDYARRHDMSCLPIDAFITDKFYPYVLGMGAVCVGLNLAFDLAHLAQAVGVTRGRFMCAAWFEHDSSLAWLYWSFFHLWYENVYYDVVRVPQCRWSGCTRFLPPRSGAGDVREYCDEHRVVAKRQRDRESQARRRKELKRASARIIANQK